MQHGNHPIDTALAWLRADVHIPWVKCLERRDSKHTFLTLISLVRFSFPTMDSLFRGMVSFFNSIFDVRTTPERLFFSWAMNSFSRLRRLQDLIENTQILHHHERREGNLVSSVSRRIPPHSSDQMKRSCDVSSLILD